MIVRGGGHILFRRRGGPEMTTGDRHSELGDQPVNWWQALGPGGLSNHWTGAVPRFAPGDFADGDELGPEFRWPISYDELVPHYEVVEEQMVITAGREAAEQLPLGAARYRRKLHGDWRPVAEAAARLDRRLVPMPLATGRRWQIARRGTEFNSYSCVLGPLLDRPELELRLDAHVTEVLPPDADGRPGVRHRASGSGDMCTIRADGVVLAAGALASTRILLRSRSLDAPDGIGNEYGVLGRYLHDHPHTWWSFETDRSLRLPDHLLYLTRPRYSMSPPLSGTSWTIGLARPHDRPKTYMARRGRAFGCQVFGSMVPRRSNRVELSDELDDLGDPKLAIAIEPRDVEANAVVDGHDVVAEVFGLAGITATATSDPVLSDAGASVHLGGTARMHDDPRFGVVDRWNRVHGIPSIVVCDASTFTTGPEKNPTLTVMAIARRAGARLAESLVGSRAAVAPQRG